jgi:hypothetical protein
VRLLPAAVALLLVLVPGVASAHTVLSELLIRMLLTEIVLATPGHQAHFQAILGDGQPAPGFEVDQFEIPLAINSVIASQLSTLPIGSSSGGFSYTFDPALGTFSRTSTSFGSAFAERALTAGRGRWNAGFTFQRATYDSLEGKDLNGGIKVYLTHMDCCEPVNTAGTPPGPFFEGDLIEETLALTLTSSTFSAFFNYGVTDRLDVSLAVPFVTINMEASVLATVVPLATEELPVHRFANGQISRTMSDSARAQGLGDIVARAKWRFFERDGAGLAAGVDVRLPTGDTEQLLGTGGVQTKLLFIGSMTSGAFAPHVNLGYTFSSVDDPAPLSPEPVIPNEINYAAGFDFAVSPRITVSADIVGRSLRDLGRLVAVPRQFLFMNINGQVSSRAFEEFTTQPGDLDQSAIATGVRFNPRGNLLISAELLVPITQAGLRDRFTPFFGIDYSF